MEHIEKTIADLQGRIQDYEQQIASMKSTINNLCDMAGKGPMYADVAPRSAQPVNKIRGDEFYGQPLARAIRKILEMRKDAGLGPATTAEIYDMLRKGGYQFRAKSDRNAIRGLQISLGKNTQTFHRIPSGKWGLRTWYPTAKPPKEAKSGKKEKAGEEEAKETDKKGGTDEKNP